MPLLLLRLARGAWERWGGKVPRLSRRRVVVGLAACGVLVACAQVLPRPQAPPAPQRQPTPPRETDVGAAQAVSPPGGGRVEAAEPSGPDLPQPPAAQAPILVRVGLATDLDRFTLPCCEEEITAQAGGERVTLASPIRLEPAARVADEGIYRLQVAALRDERQAEGLARRLAARSQESADATFDAGVGLYRVRMGRYPSREEAEAARQRFLHLGLETAWVVHEGGGLTDPGFHITERGETRWVPGRLVVISSAGDGGIRFHGRRYRGRLLLYLNNRGKLNVINEILLDDYLRGVVPREMGPELYQHLEALKAQTVAARTYTLRNLQEFHSEGYDICATPRCQVYGGMDVEHLLTDQAVAETAGEVLLYEGELVDALYSSTCGGHTENVDVVFPLKKEPYLRGVPCLEAGIDVLAGEHSGGSSLARALMRRIVPPPQSGDGRADLAARLEHLALLAGLPVPEDRLASLERRDVQRFIASVFDLALDARLFVSQEDLQYLLDAPRPDWSRDELRLAAYFAKSGLHTGPLDRPLDGKEIEETLLRLARLLRVVVVEEGNYLSRSEEEIVVRVNQEEKHHRLSELPMTFRRRGTELVAADLPLVPGDRLSIYSHGEELLALVQEVDPDGVAYDRTSPRASWTRYRSDAELAKSVEMRYPGVAFRGFEILSRGVSGRVGRIRLLGENGTDVVVEGLAVRWTLGIPDTRFTVKRLTPTKGPAGWLFTGRGWGHGVGMCQVGAYGMALRGHNYREILHHYYTGIELGRVKVARPFPRRESR